MKPILLSSFLLALPAFAGSSQVTETYSSPPPPTQDAWSFFAGASAGYLFEFDEDIYTLQLGAKSPWSVAGWSVALFAEAGWTENHEDVEIAPPLAGDEDSDLDIVPLTFNVKLERLITGGLSAYVGGGVGASYVDAEIDSIGGDDDSADDWVFTAQAFAGLAYHVNDSLEIFGGGRWIYFEDPSFRGVDLGDDWLVEAGLRYHF
jgi:opacity protein-like surface antigen